ncbi:MAG: peptidoglycan bridge formation glycyltransferase FemA/FemB family protein [Elusimicrobia bacterium]|nr:peptidoglycan bridge formation glycyltransferase FemA/FemB family protein [Elusimicrobiota bacterium]
MTDIEFATSSPPSWDQDVRELPGATLFQTSAWAHFATSYLRDDPRFVRVIAEGRPRAWLVAVRRSPFHPRLLDLPFAAALGAIARRLSPTIAIVRGPLFSPQAHAADIAAMADVLSELAATFGPVDCTLPLHGPGLPHPIFLEQVERRGWCHGREATFLVDLDRSEDAIWRDLKPSARKDVKRAERYGVTVRRVTDRSELESFWRLLCGARQRIGLQTYSIANLNEMWDCLTPGADFELIVAEHAGELVATLGIWTFGHAAIEFSSAQSDRAVRERLYASDLVKWFALRRARSAGASYFDLAGVAPRPRTPKEVGIRQFKEKWGGTLVEAPLVRIAARPK